MARDNKARREILYIKSGAICLICKKPLGSMFERHHSEHDTNGNNLNRPLYTQSLISAKPLHPWCHAENPSYGAVSQEVADKWEEFLKCWVWLVKNGAETPYGLVCEELRQLAKENKKRCT